MLTLNQWEVFSGFFTSSSDEHGKSGASEDFGDFKDFQDSTDKNVN